MNSRTNRDRPVNECFALEPRVLFNADFNHDARSDLVWHNKSTGDVVIWEVENDGIESSVALPSVPAEWYIVGFGDFNRNGDDDILWRNSATGELVVWLMDSESLESVATLPTVAPETGWLVQGVGDFTGDARADIVWRNYVTGENVVWVMEDGDTIDRSDSLQTISDLAWRIAGAADFNNDLETDLLWRNDDTGANVIWLMDGRDHTGDHNLPTVSGTDWHISSVGNFTGDTDKDILWRRLSDGSNIAWRMDDTLVVGDTAFPSLADGDWTIGAGDNRVFGDDWNRDASEDILWIDPQTGRGLLWYMNGSTIENTNSINNLGQQVRGLQNVEDFDGEGGVDFLTRDESTGEVAITLRVAGTTNFGESRRGEIRTISLPTVSDSAWQIAGVADFNGDESADILWRNTLSGENVVWLLNRGAFGGVLTLTTVAETEWDIQAVHTNDSADTADIYWRNSSTGAVVVWTVDDEQIVFSRDLFTVEDMSWHLGAAFDADLNGFTDAVWYNSDTHESVIWYYDANGFTQASSPGETPTARSEIVA